MPRALVRLLAARARSLRSGDAGRRTPRRRRDRIGDRLPRRESQRRVAARACGRRRCRSRRAPHRRAAPCGNRRRRRRAGGHRRCSSEPATRPPCRGRWRCWGSSSTSSGPRSGSAAWSPSWASWSGPAFSPAALGRPPVGTFVPRFSALALVSIGLVAMTGAYAAWVQSGTLVTVETEYGRTLLLKSGFAVGAFARGRPELPRWRSDARVAEWDALAAGAGVHPGRGRAPLHRRPGDHASHGGGTGRGDRAGSRCVRRSHARNRARSSCRAARG